MGHYVVKKGRVREMGKGIYLCFLAQCDALCARCPQGQSLVICAWTWHLARPLATGLAEAG